ncbi:MAG: hypothetical protein IT305_29585 [Chloroflexi bacterium]|nr:hypothetical protein [Chloroflexota bacterium]
MIDRLRASPPVNARQYLPPPPALAFVKVPEPHSVKNRVHMNCGADDREAAVERLIGLGATRGEIHSMYGMT